MSNLIKYPFVNIQGKEKRIISYEENDSFVPLNKSSRTIVPGEEDTDGEIREIKNVPDNSSAEAEKERLEQKKEAEQQAEWILSEAREQAARIQEEAEQQAEEVRQAAMEEGRRLGREEGLAVAEEELKQAQADIQEAQYLLEEEHRQMASVMETQYVGILCDLIQKLTGVLLEDRKDVLLHLIRSAVSEIEPSSRYTLRVAAEDLPMVEGHLHEIMTNMASGVSIDVKEEKGIDRNECIIETDTQMIDGGFQTQLDNLITTLHMLIP